MLSRGSCRKAAEDTHHHRYVEIARLKVSPLFSCSCTSRVAASGLRTTLSVMSDAACFTLAPSTAPPTWTSRLICLSYVGRLRNGAAKPRQLDVEARTFLVHRGATDAGRRAARLPPRLRTDPLSSGSTNTWLQNFFITSICFCDRRIKP